MKSGVSFKGEYVAIVSLLWQGLPRQLKDRALQTSPTNRKEHPIVPSYKFLTRRYAEDLLQGRFRMGSLCYYRLLETLTGDGAIGDDHEGIKVTAIDEFYLGPGEDPAVRKGLSGLFGGDGQLFGRNNRIQVRREGFVFCFATELTDTTVKEFCQTGPFPYNACVEIVDTVRFFEALVHTGTVDGVPIQRLFNCKLADIIYDDPSEHDFASNKMIAPGDPFKKRRKYAAQSEGRIFFERVAPASNADHIDVEFAVPPGLMHLRDVECLSDRAQALATMSSEEAVADIRAVIQYLHGVRLNRSEVSGRDDRLLRARLGHAYWAIRDGHKCDMVDGGFLSSAPLDALTMRLGDLLKRNGFVGQFWPWV
jgi:hypothetical protein